MPPALTAIRREIRPTLALALPMILTQLLGYAQVVIDTIMAGRHDALTLAGISLSAQLYSLIYLLMLGVSVGLTAAISHHHGAERIRELRSCFQQGIWLFALLGIAAAAATAGAALLPALIGSDPAIGSEARRYLLTLALPAGIYIAASPARAFLEGMAAPKANNLLIASLIPLNILGNWLFLHFGFGTQGLAISTGITYLVYTAGLYIHLAVHPRWRPYRLLHALPKPAPRALRHLFALGLPIGIANTLENIMFQYAGFIASRDSITAAGANQIAFSYMGAAFMLPLGIAASITIRTANAYGRADWHAIAARGRAAILIAIAIIWPISLITLFARSAIVSLYSSDAAILHLAANLFIITAAFQLLDALQVVYCGILRGLADNRIILIHAAISYWLIGIPAGTLLAYPLHLGLAGLWIGCAIGVGVFACFNGMRVRSHLKKHLPSCPYS